MNEYDGWSFVSYVTVRGQVGIKQEVLLLPSRHVKGWSVLDILGHLYLVDCEGRVNIALEIRTSWRIWRRVWWRTWRNSSRVGSNVHHVSSDFGGVRIKSLNICIDHHFEDSHVSLVASSKGIKTTNVFVVVFNGSRGGSRFCLESCDSSISGSFRSGE